MKKAALAFFLLLSFKPCEGSAELGTALCLRGGFAVKERYHIPLPKGCRYAKVAVLKDVLFLIEECEELDFPLGKVPRIWVFEIKNKEGILRDRLARPGGWGSAWTPVPPRSIAFIGGEGRDCYLVNWNPVQRKPIVKKLPSLPEQISFGTAVFSGGKIYLVGGKSERADPRVPCFRLNLEGRKRWESLPSFPGEIRLSPQVGIQHNGFWPSLFVFGGKNAEGKAVFNGIRFELKPVFSSGRGGKKASWKICREAPFTGEGALLPLGQSHLVATGKLRAGGKEEIFLYHTITDTWVRAKILPEGEGFDFLGYSLGEIYGGVKLEKGQESYLEIRALTWRQSKRTFPFVAFLVLLLYLAGILFCGLYFGKGASSTDDYFRGGKRLPWWASGCSIFATLLSSITFVAIPAKAFAQDWVYLPGNLVALLVAPIVVFVALPHFRQLDVTSAYEYLEERFCPALRFFGSSVFILFHLFRMAIVMSLGSLALASLIGVSAWRCVLIMGIICTIYCTSGGVRAVIWTDTVQTFVLLGGAMLCLITIIFELPQDLAGLIGTAFEAGKLRVANWHLSPTDLSLAFWVVLIGGMGQQLAPYTADQGVVQRYMTTATEKQAAKSVWIAAFLSVPASFLFFSLGSSLFVFYRNFPERLDPTIMTDQIFPLFISTELAPATAGLVVAGVFAAAQSTVSTSMNAISSSAVKDLLCRLGKPMSQGTELFVSRTVTALSGLVGTLLGLLFISPEIRSLWDSFIKVLGLCMGVLAGLFLLGMLNRRAGPLASILAAFSGACVVLGIAFWTNVVGYLYAALGISCVLAVGCLITYLEAFSTKLREKAEEKG